MVKNMSMGDRIFRILVSAVVVALYLAKVISGTPGALLIAIAVIFLATSFVNYCPLYSILGIRRWEKPQKEIRKK